MACTPCGNNTYNPRGGAAGASACLHCPNGTVSRAGAQSANECIAIQCEPGAVMMGASCGLCGHGTYAAGTPAQCIPCSPGTFSNASGATACTGLCPNGSYGVAPGATSASAACATCPPGSVSAAGAQYCSGCGAGSVREPNMSACTPCVVKRGLCNVAAAFQYSPAAFPEAAQDAPPTDPAESDTAPSWAYYAGAFIALLTVAMFMCSRRIPARWARIVDLFSVEHWVRDGAPIVKQETVQGTACSLAFVTAAVCAMSVLVVQYVTSNVVATQSLVPAVLVGSGLPIAVPYIEFEVIFVDGDQSACKRRAGSLVNVESQAGIQYSSSSQHWAFDSGICNYTYRLSSVKLGVSSSVSVSEPAWLMQHVLWTVRATSGVQRMPKSAISGSRDASALDRVVGQDAIAVAATASQVLDTNGNVVLHGALLALGGSSAAPYDDGSRVRASDTVTLQFNIQVRVRARPDCLPRVVPTRARVPVAGAARRPGYHAAHAAELIAAYFRSDGRGCWNTTNIPGRVQARGTRVATRAVPRACARGRGAGRRKTCDGDGVAPEAAPHPTSRVRCFRCDGCQRLQCAVHCSSRSSGV